MITPAHQGRRYFDDYSESWIDWAVFNAVLTDEDALRAANNPTAFYGGPGRFFSHAPVVQRSKTRTLVTIMCGYDV